MECKERNWRRGIRQARVYSVVTDRVFIAMPSAHLTQFAVSTIASQGLGVLAVGESGDVVVAAPAPDTAPMATLRERTVGMYMTRRGTEDG